MDELIGTLQSHEAEHLNKDSYTKDKKVIAITSNYGDAGDPSTFNLDDDDDKDMALFMRRFKSLMRKRSNYKGKRQTRKDLQGKRCFKGNEALCYECKKHGHIKPIYPLKKKKKKKKGKTKKKKRALKAETQSDTECKNSDKNANHANIYLMADIQIDEEIGEESSKLTYEEMQNFLKKCLKNTKRVREISLELRREVSKLTN